MAEDIGRIIGVAGVPTREARAVQSRVKFPIVDRASMIRPLRPTDLVGVGMFLRRADVAELSSHSWPKVQPESGHLPVNQVLW